VLSIKLVTTLGSVFHCNVCWVCEQIIANNSDEQQRSFGRHFDMEDELVSRISRRSIDILKQNYREDLSMEDWKLVVKLKTILKIQ